MASAFQASAFQNNAFQIDAVRARGDDAGLPWGTSERPMRVVYREEEQKAPEPKRKRVKLPVEPFDPAWLDDWMDAALIALPDLPPIELPPTPRLAMPAMSAIQNALLAAERARLIAQDEEDTIEMLLLAS